MKNELELHTYFDTPFRTTEEKIFESSNEVLDQPFIAELLDGINNAVVIMDKNRQIVALNSSAKNIFENYSTDNPLGRRLGEALNCIHSTEMPAGCGTSNFCKECGAAQTIKNHNETLNKTTNDCRITTQIDSIESSLDLRVSASTFIVNSNRYIIFTIQDISNEKRRHTLERIFFHDILNTAGAINGIAEVLQESISKEEFYEFRDLLSYSSNQLIQEIQTQRELTLAENGKLKVNIKSYHINDLLENVYNIYSKHETAKNKTLRYIKLENDNIILTDGILLTRSLGNLIKNALEATLKNQGEVVFWVEIKDDNILFHVKNDSVMPENIQLQMFQRSFSTKGEMGRGIGTYSVKLLVQQYLKGEVYFVSNEKVRTIFTIKLPKQIEN